MSGIAGWIDWNMASSIQQNVIHAMGEALSQRGPDDRGWWFSGHASLVYCHLRISEDDVMQPLVIQHGHQRYVIVCNGTLYNAKQLQKDLLALGHPFTHAGKTGTGNTQGTNTPEVILRSYIQWGAACLERFNGVYAFAIWDEGNEQLFVARDRLGIKPLFYALHGTGFAFGSEIKAILAHPEIQPVVDAEGLAEIFVIGPNRTPGNGVFRQIRELKPGHALLYNRQGLRTSAYWSLRSQPHQENLEATVEHLRHLFFAAVKRQLVAEQPLSSMLSGGLDSSSLAAIAARHYQQTSGHKLVTYSVDYRDNAQHFTANEYQPEPDAAWIPRMVSALDTKHRSVLLDPVALAETLDQGVILRDLPGMADIDTSLYLFCREIKRDAAIVLSGECADEVFCGYPWFFWEYARKAATFPWSLKVAERLHLLSPELKKLIQPEDYLRHRYEEALREVPRLEGETGEEARSRELSYLTLTRWMPVLIDRQDRMGTAAGIEIRTPFADHQLVEYVWNIPWEFKKADGYAKGILRRLMKGYLPEDVLYRRKSPFPKTYHPDYLHAVRQRLLAILDDSGSPLLPLIQPAVVRELAARAEQLHLPWFGQLMNIPQLFAYLIQVDFWLRHYRVQIRV